MNKIYTHAVDSGSTRIFEFTSVFPFCRVMFFDRISISCELSVVKMVTRQPVDEAPVAKVQVTVMLPSNSITALTDWRPVVSAY